MAGFLELKDVTDQKKKTLNSALLQNYIPKGKSRLQQLLARKKEVEITEVVITLRREFWVSRKQVHYFISSRNRDGVTVGDWGSFTITPDKSFWDFLIEKISRLTTGIFAQGNVLRSPATTNIFLLEDSPFTKEYPFPYSGVEKIDWCRYQIRDEGFWGSRDIKFLNKSPVDLEYMLAGKTPPRKTGWGVQPIRTEDISLLIPDLAKATGLYYSVNPLPQPKQEPKREFIAQNSPEQPTYSRLPLLEYFYYIERSLKETTTLLELQRLNGEYYVSWVKGADTALSSPDIQRKLQDQVINLADYHEEELNLLGDVEVVAGCVGAEIKFFTNDEGLSFPKGNLEDEDKIIPVREIKLNFVDLEDPLQFNLDKGLRRIRSAIADAKLRFSDEFFPNEESLITQLYQEQNLRLYGAEIRALTVLFSQL